MHFETALCEYKKKDIDHASQQCKHINAHLFFSIENENGINFHNEVWRWYFLSQDEHAKINCNKDSHGAIATSKIKRNMECYAGTKIRPKCCSAQQIRASGRENKKKCSTPFYIMSHHWMNSEGSMCCWQTNVHNSLTLSFLPLFTGFFFRSLFLISNYTTAIYWRHWKFMLMGLNWIREKENF